MVKPSEGRTTEVCDRGNQIIQVVLWATQYFDETRTFQIILNITGKQQSLGSQWKYIGKIWCGQSHPKQCNKNLNNNNNNNEHYNIIVDLQDVGWGDKT